MPSLSCKSASALDSLPRSSNAKRDSTALNRLQQRRQSAQQQQPSLGEFGNVVSREQQQTSRKSFSNILRNDKANQGLSSSDLPLASSDLYDGETATSPVLLKDASRDSISNEKQENEMDLKKSSNKAFRFSRTIGSAQSRPSIDSPSTSPSRGGTRKRVVTTDMVGHPTNFKHTSSYNSILRDSHEDQLQLQQLSEVAAALKLDDVVDDRLERQAASKESSASEASSSHSTTATSEDSSSECSPRKLTMSLAKVQPQMVASSSPTDSPLKAEAGLERAASKRKPVPRPRELADLCDAFKGQDTKDEEAEINVPLELEALSTPALSDEQAEQESATIRASNGKRLVQGPAGKYITDTANGRWNCALDEIKKALKSEAQDDQSAEEEELQDGMRRADAILARLDAM